MLSRRLFLQSTAFSTSLFTVPGLFAEELVKLPLRPRGRSIRTSCRLTPTTIC